MGDVGGRGEDHVSVCEAGDTEAQTGSGRERWFPPVTRTKYKTECFHMECFFLCKCDASRFTISISAAAAGVLTVLTESV